VKKIKIPNLDGYEYPAHIYYDRGDSWWIELGKRVAASFDTTLDFSMFEKIKEPEQGDTIYITACLAIMCGFDRGRP